MSRHPVVAVPRGWTTRVDDQRAIAVAIDGRHPSKTTLGYAFTEASLRRVPVLVVHSAPLAQLADGGQDARLNVAEILANWKADYPDVEVKTLLLAGPPRDTVVAASPVIAALGAGTQRPRPARRPPRRTSRRCQSRRAAPAQGTPPSQ